MNKLVSANTSNDKTQHKRVGNRGHMYENEIVYNRVCF